VVQKRFIYIPFAEIAATPDQAGLDYRDVFFEAGDRTRIHGWIVEPLPGWDGGAPAGDGSLAAEPAAVGAAPDGVSAAAAAPAAGGSALAVRGHLLFFHGNGGNVSYSMDALRVFAEKGFRTFIIDYRGYGRSEGSPGEAGLYADAEAALETFCTECGVTPAEIVYVGRSLGGGVALELALRRPPAALILESPFTSIREMAGMMRYILPVQWILTDKFDNLTKIGRLATPLLVIHSPEDEIVPFDHGRRLFDAAGGAGSGAAGSAAGSGPGGGTVGGRLHKEFLEIRGDHNGGFAESGDLYADGFTGFVGAWLGEGGAGK
jgi:fermentation-respiration switch protein FrsA (DUF1100 family)